MEKCCGKCQWFEQYKNTTVGQGQCRFTVPIAWVHHNYCTPTVLTYAEEGIDCPCFTPREEARS